MKIFFNSQSPISILFFKEYLHPQISISKMVSERIVDYYPSP